MQYLAQKSFTDIFGEIQAPSPLSTIAKVDPTGETGINSIITNSVALIFSIAAVSFVFMFLISVVQMILSGGDKESVAKARARMNWALIGIGLLAVSFLIFKVLGFITGFKFVP